MGVSWYANCTSGYFANLLTYLKDSKQFKHFIDVMPAKFCMRCRPKILLGQRRLYTKAHSA